MSTHAVVAVGRFSRPEKVASMPSKLSSLLTNRWFLEPLEISPAGGVGLLVPLEESLS